MQYPGRKDFMKKLRVAPLWIGALGVGVGWWLALRWQMIDRPSGSIGRE